MGLGNATLRGAWVIGTAYVLDDVVTFDNATYAAVASSTGVEPDTDDGTHWQQISNSHGGWDGMPGAAIDQLGAVAAVASVQEATANGTAADVTYLQATAATWVALANSLKAEYNTAQADIVALRGSVAALTTTVNTLLDELAQAGVLESS